MRVLDIIRRNPVIALTGVVVGIGAWVVAELVIHPPDSSSGRPPGASILKVAQTTPAPPASPDSAAPALAVLPRLRPGMTRVEVEGILGQPPAEAVQPVTVQDGQMRYWAAYDLGDPDPPHTIRPIKRMRLPAPPRETPRPQVALEFDASKPGHPVTGILYLDPLF